MNYEAWGEFDQPFFTHETKLRELEEQLYGHVLEAIDWDAIHNLEHAVFTLIGRKLRARTELALDLAAAIMDRALTRAAGDPCRYGDSGPPLGISEAEAKAVAFDDTCPFCIDERKAEDSRAAAQRARRSAKAASEAATADPPSDSDDDGDAKSAGNGVNAVNGVGGIQREVKVQRRNGVDLDDATIDDDDIDDDDIDDDDIDDDNANADDDIDAHGEGHSEEVDEPCPLCDDIARSWREQHREILVKAGLWRSESEPS